ncbi:PspC domain-containing protein [Arthrobacter sp. NEB 688]|uniref:PspC domain-containing protein n=1 Tax=Arthrobacter sp. NEB 688 TaxID=904039 RepID=UPI0015669DC3|nr:PspC domain-containing protein [Arthrobacter sp. NEB 688]QKE85688.1 PspC domain-containing protein [Arthrobacter sp. NEB 688]
MTESSTSQMPPTGAPTALDDGLARLRRSSVRRDTERRWFGGVCAGVAARFDVDPLLIRAAAIALTIAGGIGIPLYLVLWLLLPDVRGEILAERAVRGSDAWAIVLLVLTGIVLLVGAVSVLGDGNAWGGSLWLLVPVGLVVWFVATRSRTTPTPWAGQAPPPPPAGATMTSPPPAGAPAAYRYPPGPQSAYGTPPPPPGATYPPRPQGPSGGMPMPPAPPRPLGPPPPPAPRRRRPSGFVGLVSLGLVIAVVGLVAAVAQPLGFTGEPVVLGLALALAAVSAIVLGLGASGRASGFSGFLVIVLGLVTVLAVAAAHSTARGGVGDRVWTPTSSSLPASYSLGAGDATLDLGGLVALPAGSGDPSTVAVSMGVGELTVRVPAGMDVRFETRIGVGELRHDRETSDGGLESVETRSGTDLSPSLTVGDAASPGLVVTTDVGLGDVTIIEES